MISVISPAKSMDFESECSTNISSNLITSKQTRILLDKLKEFKSTDIAKLMKVSTKIAELNHDRYLNFDNLPEKQALFAFNGDVYNNIDTNSLDDNALNYAQKHLRILSGLYGIIKPLDKIRAYRLEMGTKLGGIAPKGLHKFWEDIVTKTLNKELSGHDNKIIVNIASNEYFSAIDKNLLLGEIININFRENRNGELRNIAINAKRARGMFADFIIRNEIDLPKNLVKFDNGGYNFNKELSSSKDLFFIKNQ